MRPRGFASDNYAGIHPEVLAALAAANAAHAPAYGADAWTEQAVAAVRARLGEQAEPFFVFNGTGANVLCLATLCRPWEAVVCVESAHLHVDEAAAPEMTGRVKLLTVPAADGKLTPELCATRVGRVGDEHAVQARVVSITQSTELGTVYELDEIRALAAFAHERGMLLHVDGARIFNGAAAIGADLRTMLTDTGVDALSLGGTKIGLMNTEAAVFLRPGLAEHAKWVRKQMTQLASKHRFLTAQWAALLAGDLAERAAAHANAMAARLADAVAGADGVRLTQQPRANAVFAVLDPAVTERLQREWRFYGWDERTGEVRWMTSWDTTPEDVDDFAAAVRAEAARRP